MTETTGRWGRTLYLLAPGSLGLALAISVTLASGFPPAPAIHDEFAQLLGADTFAEGRLASTVHPHADHFESFHILQRPSYAMKYPPAPAAMMAIGQVAFGHPIVGVWLGYALMCAALAWMLEAWVPRRWAMWGGMLAAFWFAGIHANTGYWTLTYWGGSVGTIGGALLLGGFGRLSRRGMVAPVAMGVGAVVLAASRPFEGLFAVIAVGAGMLLAFRPRGVAAASGRRLLPTLAVVTVVGMSGGALLGLYNSRVTGRFTEMPYTEYERQYASSPFVLPGASPPPAPSYRHDVMRCFYTVGTGHNALGRWPAVYLAGWGQRAKSLMGGFTPLFALPLLVATPLMLRRRKFWLPLAVVGSVAAALVVTPWNLFMHYAAPATGPWLVLLVAAFRYLGTMRVGRRRFGLVLQHAVFLIVAGSAVTTVVAFVATRKQVHSRWEYRRQAMADSLSREPTPQLVLVEYGPRHRGDHEWVYNAAAIDASPVVWARSMGGARDAALVEYFRTRKVSRLRVDDDAGPFILEPIDGVAALLAAPASMAPSTCSGDSTAVER